MPDQLARQRSTTLLFYGCIILLGYLLYQLFEPFLTPLAWAAIFAAFFHSRHKRLETRFGKTGAASISTGAVTLIIVVPFVLIVMAFIDEATQTLGSIDLADGGSRGLERVQRAWSWLQRQRFGRDIPNLDVVLKMGASRIAGMVTEGAGLLARSIAVVVVNVIIMLFALFFFFRDGDAIMSRLRRVLPFDPSFREGRIRETAELIKASISSGIIVALVQGASRRHHVRDARARRAGLLGRHHGVLLAVAAWRMDCVAARRGVAAADRRDRPRRGAARDRRRRHQPDR